MCHLFWNRSTVNVISFNKQNIRAFAGSFLLFLFFHFDIFACFSMEAHYEKFIYLPVTLVREMPMLS